MKNNDGRALMFGDRIEKKVRKRVVICYGTRLVGVWTGGCK